MVFDIQLRRPGASIQEWADELGVTPAFLRRVMQSDEYNRLLQELQEQHRQRVLLALDRMTPQVLTAMQELLKSPSAHPMATAKVIDTWRALMTDFVLTTGGRTKGQTGPVNLFHQVVTKVYTGTAPEDDVIADVDAFASHVPEGSEGEANRSSLETIGEH